MLTQPIPYSSLKLSASSRVTGVISSACTIPLGSRRILTVLPPGVRKLTLFPSIFFGSPYSFLDCSSVHPSLASAFDVRASMNPISKHSWVRINPPKKGKKPDLLFAYKWKSLAGLMLCVADKSRVPRLSLGQFFKFSSNRFNAVISSRRFMTICRVLRRVVSKY